MIWEVISPSEDYNLMKLAQIDYLNIKNQVFECISSLLRSVFETQKMELISTNLFPNGIICNLTLSLGRTDQNLVLASDYEYYCSFSLSDSPV